jgi:hypothetical protein
MRYTIIAVLIITAAIFMACSGTAKKADKFKVVAFYTAKNDLAHISFVEEANKWFQSRASENNFSYEATNDWNNMNDTFLGKYDVVLFLDTRPDSTSHRLAFERYMKNGGGWMGFHFSGFALTPSDFPQNWNWYHQEFLGAGEYKGNTWRPTRAILRVEDGTNPITKNIPSTFKSAPNEWYSWANDLRNNRDIQILVSIDSTSFPLGTGPKLHEIWHEGYYPVVWTNKNYRMVYVNMGHNDMDYEGGTNKSLSSSFSSPEQNQLLLNALQWLGNKK